MTNSTFGIIMGKDSRIIIRLGENSEIILEKGENEFPLRFKIINYEVKKIDACIVLKDDKLEILHAKDPENGAEIELLPIGYGLNE